MDTATTTNSSDVDPQRQLSPLIAAGAHGDIATLTQLLEERRQRQGDAEEEEDDNSILEMALWGACSNKHPDAVKLLLDEVGMPCCCRLIVVSIVFESICVCVCAYLTLLILFCFQSGRCIPDQETEMYNLVLCERRNRRQRVVKGCNDTMMSTQDNHQTLSSRCCV